MGNHTKTTSIREATNDLGLDHRPVCGA